TSPLPARPFCTNADFHALSRASGPSCNQLRKSSRTPSHFAHDSFKFLGKPHECGAVARQSQIPASQGNILCWDFTVYRGFPAPPVFLHVRLTAALIELIGSQQKST